MSTQKHRARLVGTVAARCSVTECRQLVKMLINILYWYHIYLIFYTNLMILRFDNKNVYQNSKWTLKMEKNHKVPEIFPL